MKSSKRNEHDKNTKFIFDDFSSRKPKPNVEHIKWENMCCEKNTPCEKKMRALFGSDTKCNSWKLTWLNGVAKPEEKKRWGGGKWPKCRLAFGKNSKWFCKAIHVFG